MPAPSHALLAPYDGTAPRIAPPLRHAGRGASVLGRVTLGARAWLGDFAVLRADGHTVDIGDDFHLGAHGTVHIAHEVYPTVIGHRVSGGRAAVIHACTVADDCVIEDGAVILDGSVIGPGAVIAAGSVVFPRSTLEGGWLYAGNPAKPLAPLTADELQARHAALRAGTGVADAATGLPEPALDAFVAGSALVAGDIAAGEGVGIWYGCRLTAWPGCRIEIGAGTNVQDNTVIDCRAGDAIIAGDVTIGHNVTIADCRIGPNSLVGIGAVLAPGTVVERDVLVAAGARTEPGQVLTEGQVWAGVPARPIGRMDARKRAMLAEILPHYRMYAERFRATPHLSLHSQGEDRTP